METFLVILGIPLLHSAERIFDRMTIVPVCFCVHSEKVLDPVQYHTVVEKAFQSAIENGGLMCGLLRHQ